MNFIVFAARKPREWSSKPYPHGRLLSNHQLRRDAHGILLRPQWLEPHVLPRPHFQWRELARR
jgi:hypothetical protein